MIEILEGKGPGKLSTVIEGIDDRNFIMVSRFPHNCAHDGRNIKTFLDGNKVRCHPGSNRIFIIGGQARQFCRVASSKIATHASFWALWVSFQEIDGFVRLHLGEDGSCPFSWQNLSMGGAFGRHGKADAPGRL